MAISQSQDKPTTSESLQDFQQKWDQAVKNHVFPSVNRSNPLDLATKMDSQEVGDFDAKYWNAVYRASTGESTELISEVRKNFPPNPITAASLGKDQSPVVTPNWTDGEVLAKINKLKVDLHELGDKIAGADVKNKKVRIQGKEGGDDILKRIRSLQDQIDDLSDSLSPDKTQEIQS